MARPLYLAGAEPPLSPCLPVSRTGEHGQPGVAHQRRPLVMISTRTSIITLHQSRHSSHAQVFINQFFAFPVTSTISFNYALGIRPSCRRRSPLSEVPTSGTVEMRNRLVVSDEVEFDKNYTIIIRSKSARKLPFTLLRRWPWESQEQRSERPVATLERMPAL